MADETRGTTPRMKPAAPSSLSSCAATERNVGFGLPGSNGAVCSRVFTTSSGVVSSPEVAPAHTAAKVCTGTMSDAAGGGASEPRAADSSDQSTRWYAPAGGSSVSGPAHEGAAPGAGRSAR